MDDKYPKFRHHQSNPSTIVTTPEQEAELTPDVDGWTDSLAEARAPRTAPAPEWNPDKNPKVPGLTPVKVKAGSWHN